MHHRSLAMRYSLFSMLPRWFSMHHILLSMHDRIPTNVVAKLQLNSDIPTNSDKIFIVFPVFLFLPLPSRRAHLHKIYDHLCENYDHLHAAGGCLHENYDDLHENYDDLHKNYDHLHVLAVHLRHTPSPFHPEGASSETRAGQWRDARSSNLFRRNLGDLTIMP